MDSGREVGLGHLTRSISIAQRIKKHYSGTEICFLINGNKFSINLLIKNGFSYELQGKQKEEKFIFEFVRKSSADVLFIDKLFPYSPAFIRKIRKYICVSMFHNICEGAFECDQFILPASHIDEMILQDSRWLKGPVKFYGGFPYIVLNDNILQMDKKSKINTDPIHIILTTGGSDPKGIMSQLLEYLVNFKFEDIKIIVLIGEIFSDRVKLEKLRGKLSKVFSIRPFNYADFANADLAVNTFGVSTYELIYLGIPTLSIGHSEQNAKGSAYLAEKYGFTYDLGLFEDLTQEKFLGILNTVLADPTKLENMQKKSRGVIDGLGAGRVAELIYILGSA